MTTAQPTAFAALSLQPARLYTNLGPAALVTQALLRGEAALTSDGALNAATGSHTGRSPNDKFVVRDATSEATIDWGRVNQPISAEAFAALWARMQAWAKGRELFVQDLFCGADPTYRLPVRFVTQYAWHNLFVRNMFIRPSAAELASLVPAYTVVNFPDFVADPATDGVRSPTFILVNLTQKLILIGGTAYAGEMKKAIFTIQNYLLPAAGVMPMHASANVGPKGDVCIFFGLSGTGKTTLSADASRTLIGDDEHGWSDMGVFNFEGGCYAKAIRLNAAQEPEIYAASRRFGTVLENVVMDEAGAVDFADNRLAENSRSCYPLDYIPNASATGMAGMPRNIVMLTCDAFGVLPPVSRLTPAQAMAHFLSGYTARVAGTERGVTAPQATFSACFGAPFMPRPPALYAELLGKKMQQHQVTCWLVNTGWSGGAAGTGERMPLPVTRQIIRAIHDGSLAQQTFIDDGVFGLSIPQQLGNIPATLLQPRRSWADQAAYDAQAAHLANLFAENFTRFAGQVSPTIAEGLLKFQGRK